MLAMTKSFVLNLVRSVWQSHRRDWDIPVHIDWKKKVTCAWVQ